METAEAAETRDRLQKKCGDDRDCNFWTTIAMGVDEF